MAGKPSKQVNKQSSSGYSLLSLFFHPEVGDRTAIIYYIYFTLETCRARQQTPPAGNRVELTGL
jgi:hypothetical protein